MYCTIYHPTVVFSRFSAPAAPAAPAAVSARSSIPPKATMMMQHPVGLPQGYMYGYPASMMQGEMVGRGGVMYNVAPQYSRANSVAAQPYVRAPAPGNQMGSIQSPVRHIMMAQAGHPMHGQMARGVNMMGMTYSHPMYQRVPAGWVPGQQHLARDAAGPATPGDPSSMPRHAITAETIAMAAPASFVGADSQDIDDTSVPDSPRAKKRRIASSPAL